MHQWMAEEVRLYRKFENKDINETYFSADRDDKESYEGDNGTEEEYSREEKLGHGSNTTLMGKKS